MFLLAGLLVGLFSQSLPAAADERSASLREQVRTLETLAAQAKNPREKARLEEKKQRVNEELAVLDERQSLEARERALAHRRAASPLATLRDRLRDVDVTADAAAARAASVGTKRQQVQAARDDLAAQVAAKRQEKESPDLEVQLELAQLEEKLFTRGEELRALALEREVAEDEADLAHTAVHLREQLKAAEANASTASVRALIEAYTRVRGERKSLAQFDAQAVDLDQNAKVSQTALDLARQKLAKDDEELGLLERQTGFLNRDPQVERLIAEQRTQKNALGERLPLMARQVEAIKRSQQALQTRRELTELEVGWQDEQLENIRATWLQRLRWPGLTLLCLVGFQVITSRGLLPLVYKKESLFLSRRIVRYLLTAIAAAILVGFLFDDLSTVATMLGVVSAALVISLQDVCTSVFGWFVIMAGAKLRIGDRLEVDGMRGDVIDNQLLRTTLVEVNGWLGLDQPTGRVILIPNNFVFKSKVFNFSHGHPFIWGKVDLTVTFATPVASALVLFQRVLEEETREEFAEARRAGALMEERYGVEDANYEPRIYTRIADSGVTLSLFFVTHYRHESATRNRLNRRLVAELETHRHIQLAYTTLHIRNEHAPSNNSPSATLGPAMTSPPFPMREEAK
ncbi:MAG: Transporter, small conductance mechanosensitive ion channel (MscS) family [Verrucomicrobia bacterium]|nr:Transporter, small conductance mechanosensitive ion channel (MscS) family [Verrucomicrobiota bacterium]